MSSAALPSPADSSPPGSQGDHATPPSCTPTSDHEDEAVEQFYEQTDSMIAKTPKKDILLVQGDWHAKVSPDAYQHWAETVGRSGIGDTDDRGWRLLEFAKSHRLALAYTLHPKVL